MNENLNKKKQFYVLTGKVIAIFSYLTLLVIFGYGTLFSSDFMSCGTSIAGYNCTTFFGFFIVLLLIGMIGIYYLVLSWRKNKTT